MAMILLLHGHDDFRRRERRLRAIAVFGVPAEQVTVLEAQGLTRAGLEQAVLALGLFSEKRAVVAPHLLSKSPKQLRDSLEPLFAEIDAETLLIIEEDQLDRRLAITKWLTKHATVEAFEPLAGGQLERWITDRLRRQRTGIERPAVTALIAAVGSNLWQLAGELDKLALAASARETAITAGLIKELVQPTVVPEIFTLTDALLTGARPRAALALTKLMSHGENALGILGMLAYHVRTLALVRDFAAGGPAPKLHPFVLSKYRTLATRLEPTTIQRWFDTLTTREHDVKTGRMEPETAVQLVVYQLAS